MPLLGIYSNSRIPRELESGIRRAQMVEANFIFYFLTQSHWSLLHMCSTKRGGSERENVF